MTTPSWRISFVTVLSGSSAKPADQNPTQKIQNIPASSREYDGETNADTVGRVRRVGKETHWFSRPFLSITTDDITRRYDGGKALWCYLCWWCSKSQLTMSVWWVYPPSREQSGAEMWLWYHASHPVLRTWQTKIILFTMMIITPMFWVTLLF